LDKNSGEAKQLIFENETMKAEVAKLRAVQSELSERASNYLIALVYSRYPFNFKNELLVNVGARDGVAPGSAVIFGGILIGEVERVFDGTSLIMTVFDNRFKLPVRIGDGGVQSLLQGGSSPKAALIPREAGITAGDIVYSASPNFPYGLPIGEITDVKISSDQLFNEAQLKFGYDANSIMTVLIEKNTNK
jgi:rod shape-determining protein MreC